MWQDYVMATCNWLFAAALVPAIRRRQPPAFVTCLMTAALLCVLAGTLASLGLVQSALGTAASAAGWWTLTWQSARVRS